MKVVAIIGAAAVGVFLLWKAGQLPPLGPSATSALSGPPGPSAPGATPPNGGFNPPPYTPIQGIAQAPSIAKAQPKLYSNPLSYLSSKTHGFGLGTGVGDYTARITDPGLTISQSGHGTAGSVLSAIANPGGTLVNKVIGWL